MNLVESYFDALTSTQKEQFNKLEELYGFWNSQINVISRKDFESFYEHHVLHSLGIAKVIQFKKGTKVLDVGTGGGFPRVPLAIMFPEVEFHLVDSIGKKIKVVNEVSSAIGLKNLKAEHKRAEEVQGKFDFVVSRAVTRLINFYPWVKDKFLKNSFNDLPNGILYLKGVDLVEEFEEIKKNYQIYPLKKYFKEEFFESKAVIHIPVS
jgi:16S rRNA (guanine527-N7)-methyltransferase